MTSTYAPSTTDLPGEASLRGAEADSPQEPASTWRTALKMSAQAFVGTIAVLGVGFTIWTICYVVWALVRLSEMDFSSF
jgi:hypothetical protein